MPDRCRIIRDTLVIPAKCRERFLPLEAPEAAPLQALDLTMAGLSDLVPGYEVGRVEAWHHLLLYIVEGQGRFYTVQDQMKLKAGHVLIVPSGLTYGYKTTSARMRLIWFHPLDNAHWQRLGELGITLRKSFLIPNLLASVNGLLGEAHRNTHASRRASYLFSELIALYLNQELEEQIEPAARRYQEMLFELWDSVSANLQHPWTVKDMASRLHMSPVHFHRVCQRHEGITPMHKVYQLRMLRAEQLLKADYPIKLIAELVGYQNSFAFSVAFKRHAGVSPRHFKDMF